MRLHWVTKTALVTLAAFVAFVGYIVATAPGAAAVEQPPEQAIEPAGPAALPSCSSPALEDAAIALWMKTDGKLSRLRDLAEVEAESSPLRVVCRARTIQYATRPPKEGWVKFSVERHGADQWFIQFLSL